MNLELNNIWAEWAKAIAENMELKDRVTLGLRSNEIRDEWAEAISHMELKEWVTLGLWRNQIWAKWAEAISKIKLKDWVMLNLRNNQIWDDWAKALSKMRLKDWVTLYLWDNEIWAKIAPRKYDHMVTPEFVANKALKHALKWKDISIPWIYAKLIHLTASILPDKRIMKWWMIQQNME